MNQRIGELWRDCVLKHTNDPMNWQMAADEFAELIIVKCLTICEELGDKGMDGHYCADEISRTFRS
jgi:hypothetical protein